MLTRPKPSDDVKAELGQTLNRSRKALLGVALFSSIINILMLSGPLFMMQVYDRVLPSRSIPTLIALALLVGLLFAIQGVLDGIRARVLQRIGRSFDSFLSGRVFNTILRLPLAKPARGDGLQPVRDLDQIRTFLGSAGPAAFFDLPWMPLYIVVCYLIHPLIGYAAVAGAFVIVAVSLTAEFSNRGPSREAAELAGPRNSVLDAGRRNAEVVAAMGMSERLRSRWESINSKYLDSHQKAADRTSGLSSIARTFRLFIQSMVLALGAYLVIENQVTTGAIIASAILVSRALGPVEQAVAHWKNLVATRISWRRLSELLKTMPEQSNALQLPAPQKTLSVEHVTAVPPGNKRLVVHDIAFTLSAGDGLGVVGASGSGKSSLARLLIGAWRPVRGTVRLDGASLDQWSSEQLGAHIGYLPQDIELFDGSVADNICRFDPDAQDEDVIAAAMAAGVHELILKFPDGYETQLGDGGSALSAGQRQRVALARALYRDPFLVVLDEPNSNLDGAGEEALTAAIRGVRKRGGVVVVIAHRPSAIAAVNLVLAMGEGKQMGFGPKEEIVSTTPRPVKQVERTVS